MKIDDQNLAGELDRLLEVIKAERESLEQEWQEISGNFDQELDSLEAERKLLLAEDEAAGEEAIMRLDGTTDLYLRGQ